jgi:protoporphyrinogen oxidase
MNLPARAVHSLIIGAGPSGLSAAYTLARAGFRPLVVESERAVGGQVKSVRRGEFVLDLGRKELYSRIPEIIRFWDEVLGEDLRPYDHRVGSLYEGRILELSTRHRGLTRGVPLGAIVAGVTQLFYARLASLRRPSVNLEDYWYQKTGKRFARMFAQGYWEKLRGVKWADSPVPDVRENHRTGYERVKQAFSLFSTGRPYHQSGWKHPRYGVGQLCESLAAAVRSAGGEVLLGSRVTGIRQEQTTHKVRVAGLHGEQDITASFMISSLEIDRLLDLLDDNGDTAHHNRQLPRDVSRSVVLVYLFLDEVPRFPHAWVEVNDPRLRAGRITNYSGFNGQMVPAGKTCLCVEFFRDRENHGTSLSDADFRQLALDECARYDLIDPAKCFDTLVLHQPRSHAALTWRHWDAPEGRKVMSELRRFPNVFHVNRGGVDRACHAGIEAARAIISGSRERFDVAAHPARAFLDDPPSATVGEGAAIPQTI